MGDITVSARDPHAHRYEPARQRPARKKRNSLDSVENKDLLRKIEAWFQQEVRRQSSNRYQMAMDEDYYDALQWLEEESAELIARGQAPVVYNEIKPTIDWMMGTERRTRIDGKVLPRKKDGADDAEVKTELLKYLSDTNKSVYVRSEAFGKAIKGGMGWIEIGVRGDDTDEPLYCRSQDWRQMLYDSNSQEKDLSDSRYLFRWKWIDSDIAEIYFPERRNLIRQASADGMAEITDEDGFYLNARLSEPGEDYAKVGKYAPYDNSAFTDSARDRVKIKECWYRKPRRVQLMRGCDLSGEIYDAEDARHFAAVETGEASLYDRIEMELRVAIFCDAGLLYEGPSPYKHGRFPFIPVWAYRRSKDNAPYSPIRGMRDSQDSLNKRGSKAIWILSSTQVEMEDGAVDDVYKLLEEVSRPDGVIVRKKGYELKVNRDVQLAREHLTLMDRDVSFIRNSGGVTSENLGRETNATSGKAIIARQDQGSVITAELFDNLRYAAQLSGEIELSLIEQFFNEEKTVRIVGPRGHAKFIELNTRDEATGEILNDITARKADYVISEQDYRDTIRIAMFESLFEITGRLAQMAPDVALKMLDLVVEMADVPNRDDLVARIREINGMRAPEAEPTPEEQAAQQQQQAQAQAQQELIQAMARADLAEKEARTEKLRAEALNRKLEGFYAAIQGAGLVAQTPTITPVADDLLKAAGYQESPHEGQRQGIETPQIDGFPQRGLNNGWI